MYTCLSCSIAFPSAEEQRSHYQSDHHRYNMKRRVASLPPISLSVFEQRALERKDETAAISSPRTQNCVMCNKSYTTENAFKSHLQSKRHKDRELRGPAAKPIPRDNSNSTTLEEDDNIPNQKAITISDLASQSIGDHSIENTDEKFAVANPPLSVLDCLFCSQISPSLESNLIHMSNHHSFFVPDADYLIDMDGLIQYLGEKLAVGNICIFCNENGREFKTLEAVRRHMIDKSHCKIAYGSEKDRLEISDYYDFTPSYPDGGLKKRTTLDDEQDDWEDVEDEDLSDTDKDGKSVNSDSSSLSEAEAEITYGDSHLELVLPSGARIGHRTMRRYYAQSFHARSHGKAEDPNSGAALVRRLVADKDSVFIPRKGGYGAFGSGTEVIKARNRGEAREAGRHVREFRDQRRREEFKTKVGFIGNSQKHYRDPPAMPIATDNTWPPGLLTIFEHSGARHATFENRYYGPYNTLLHYCFGDEFTFYVAPQIPPPDDGRNAVDFIIFLVVFDSHDKVVLILEAKDNAWAHWQKAELRYQADVQMRDRYALMLDKTMAPRFWGISALGTSMRVYYSDIQSFDVDPPFVPRPQPTARRLPPDFLAGEWVLDILSQDGFNKMKEIVTDILAHNTL